MNIETIMATVDGYLGVGDAQILNRYAALVRPPNVIVELGSYKGLSTCVMAIHAVVDIYSVDPHENAGPYSTHDFDDWSHNTGSFIGVYPLLLTSVSAANGWTKPIGLLFIDADHEYESVRDDLAAWLPHIAPDGVIAMHDNFAPGVIRALDERTDLELLETVESISVYKVVNS